MDGAEADAVEVVVVFFVITLSPSCNPLVISVCVSFCIPIVTATRVRVVAVDAVATEVEEDLLRVEDPILIRVDDDVLEANAVLSNVDDALANLLVDDARVNVPAVVPSSST